MTESATTEPSDIGQVEVSEHAQTFFEMACGFLKSKKEFDRLADGMVGLQSVESFGKTPIQTEDVNQDGEICLDDVYDSATMIKPSFDEWIRNFGKDVGLSDQFIKIPSTLKAKERAIEKVKDDYDGNFSRLADIVRASLVTSNKDEAYAVWKLLDEKQQAGEPIEVVRLKNRFATPPFNGYRDLLISFKIKVDNQWHVCELQVHYAPISALKKETHKYYQFFRTYFKGNVDAVNERLRVLDATIGQSTATSLYDLIQEICSSEDLERLDALERLLGNEMMDEQEILKVVRKAELQATKKKHGASSKEAADCMEKLGKAYRKLKDNNRAKELFQQVLDIRRSTLSDHDESTLEAAYYLGVTLRKLKLFDEALPLITETLQLQKEHLGMEHRHTLRSMNNIASLRMAMGDYEAAHGLHIEAFEARKAALGANNQDTLQSQGCIATALAKLGLYKEAVEMFKSLLTEQETILGPTHSDALMTLENLAACFEEADDFKNEDAIVQYQELRKRQRKKYGAEHDSTTEKTEATIQRLALDAYGSRICIVDGGSRGTRCYTFEMESGTLKRHAAPKQLEKLDSILFDAKKNGKGVNSAANVIDEWLSESGVKKDIGLLFIGGTAGLRTAIECGKFSDAWVLGVEQALSSKQWPVVFFEAISGETEASLELAATRFAASSNLQRDGVGLFSLGGGSTQMVEHMGDSHHSFKFGCRYVSPKDTSSNPVYFKEDILFSPEALADENHSALEAANIWRTTVSEALSEVEESNKLSGSYVAISTTYWVARYAGISSTLLTVAEAKEGIRRHQERLLQETPLTADWRKKIEENPKEAEKLSANIVVDVFLDRMFQDDAEIYFERQWKVPSTSDNEFITNWPTGKALDIFEKIRRSGKRNDGSARVESFGGNPVQTEDVNQDGEICLDDVYNSATMIKPSFDEWIRNFGQEVGLSDQFIKIPSTLKAKERAIEKVKDDYNGNFSRLADIVRASLVTSNKDEAYAVWKLLDEKQQAGEPIEVVRLKNRFATPPFNGYRDLLVSFKIKVDGAWHVCELQVHYAPISALKKETHKYYQFFRTYFKGNIDAVNERLRVLDATIGQSTATSLYDLIQEICSSEDLERLGALERLLGNEMMDEQKILKAVWESRLQITKKRHGASSKETGDCMMELGKAYRYLGDNKLAKELFQQVLDIRRSNLSDHDESTLEAAYSLGATLRKLKLFDEALPLITETLQLQQDHLGILHKDTLRSMNSIASLRMAMGDYEAAHGLHIKAFEARKAALGANNQATLQSQGSIATALVKLRRYKEAVEMFKSLLTEQEAILGPTHSDALMTLENLAACFEEVNEFKNEDAIVQYRELRKRQRKKYGTDHKSTLKTKVTLERLALQTYGSRICIVDGGSRGTRCYTFEMQSGTLKRQTAPMELEKLDSILFDAKKNGKGVNSAASVIEEWLSECGVDKDIGLLYIGGTDGLRTAIDYGRFSDAWVLGVEEALSKHWPVVFFEAISGLKEAALELAATRFAASSSLQRDGVGLFSLGGGSTQMVEHMGDSHHSFKFGCRYVSPKDTSSNPVYFKEDILCSPEALADENHSALEAANIWRTTVSEALSEVEESNKLSGSYVAISTTYWVARYAGISSKLLTVGEAKEGIRRHQERLLQETPLTADWRKKIEENPKEAEKLSANIVVDVFLDRMFQDDAEIYFERHWKVPSTSDNEFITNWPTGKALEIFGRDDI